MTICQAQAQKDPPPAICRQILSQTIKLLSKYAHTSKGSSTLTNASIILVLVTD